MGYLQPTDYINFGLDPATTDDWVTAASTLMESYCRRTSLNPVQYVERMRLTEGAQTVRLTYLPLAAVAPATSPLVSINARYARPRRGELVYPIQSEIVGPSACRAPGRRLIRPQSTGYSTPAS
jgi:hypothetical protein